MIAWIPVGLIVSCWPYSGFVVLTLLLLLLYWFFRIVLSIAELASSEGFKERYEFWYGCNEEDGS